ncbi:hypothetical protein [Cupriavidus necator]|uniref:hypothetical protein n=1 Tax=Cupriavidus necator TaxID=106590 RepID=UPI0012D2C90F|nr:hypothetical protein [Cupriavidus necator]
MQKVFKTDRAWFHTLMLLNPEGRLREPRHHPARPEHRHDCFQRCTVKVSERHGLAFATIAWSGSTTGRYGDQL